MHEIEIRISEKQYHRKKEKNLSGQMLFYFRLFAPSVGMPSFSGQGPTSKSWS